MTMSLEEFRASLTRPDLRGSLGLQLTDVEAQQVAADPESSQSWYAYWLSTQPTSPMPPPPAQDAPAFDAPPPVDHAQSTHDAQPTYAAQPPYDAQPTAPVVDAYGLPLAVPSDPAYAATAAYPGYDVDPAAAPMYPGYGPAVDGEPAKKRRVGLWVTLSVVGALLLIAAIIVVVAFTTARHWTKVDSPEKPETFHSEEYETGRYDVTMDDVNPCTVNQDWTDCTNQMSATYTAACADVELTETATLLCTEYKSAIDEMKAQDGDGYYVATLGSYGNLHRAAEIDTRQVSNDDYEPAVTHEAVCYLEFIGECE